MPAAPPKYSAIADKLIAQISAGEYQPGDLLPSEPQLSRHFCVSRHTIRSALRSLYEKGLIVSQRGRGSVVQATAVAPRYSYACDSIDDVLQYAAATSRQVAGYQRVLVDDALAARLGCAAGYPWWEVHTCRSEPGGAVVASSLIWVPDNCAAVVADLAASDEPLFMRVERHLGCHIARLHQSIAVAAANTREAQDLALEPGVAVMSVERHFYDERGGLLEVARTVHPPQNFRYEMNIQRVIGR